MQSSSRSDGETESAVESRQQCDGFRLKGEGTHTKEVKQAEWAPHQKFGSVISSVLFFLHQRAYKLRIGIKRWIVVISVEGGEKRFRDIQTYLVRSLQHRYLPLA